MSKVVGPVMRMCIYIYRHTFVNMYSCVCVITTPHEPPRRDAEIYYPT